VRDLLRRSFPAAAIAVLAVGAGWLSLPSVTVACSCVMPEDIVETAGQDPGSAVFTAIAGPKTGRDIPVVVTRWFRGMPAVGPLIIEGGPDDDMCGPTSPSPGGEYLFVTYQGETSRFTINGCSVQADITTPDGQALLARAIGRFGPGAISPTNESPPGGSAGSLDVGVILPVVLIGVFAVSAFASAIAVVRRRRDDG
jgi:hypothetical protein